MSDVLIVELVDFLFVFFGWCCAMTVLHLISSYPKNR